MSIYCPGVRCSRKDTCALHICAVEGSQIIDYSIESTGFGGIDDYGNYFSHHEYECGDLSDGYKDYVSTKLSKESFEYIHCRNCGSQRCEGINSEWFEGCTHKHELEEYYK